MYRRKILSGIYSLQTPDYYGRSFIKARLEGLEYSILLSFISNTASQVHYKYTLGEIKDVVYDWGKMWVLVDDIQDEQLFEISDSELLNLLLGKGTPKCTHPLMTDLCRVTQSVLERIVMGNYSAEYRKFTKMCFDNQKLCERFRTNQEQIANTLHAAEQKGGAFCLSLVLALSPIQLNKNIKEAIFTAGSWGQAIDDFADVQKDRDSGVFTIFTSSLNPQKTLERLAVQYQKKILSLTNDKGFLIPLMQDLTDLAKISKAPLIKNIFAVLNH